MTIPELNHKEKFILDITSNKKNGFYVELGGSHSSENSNTNKLEKYYDWDGFAIEIVPELQKEYSLNRRNPCVLGDAMKFDYIKHFNENNFPKQIDFLSVNIDPGYDDRTGRMLGNPAQSLLGLIALPLSSYRFTIIMFEHDSLQHYKNESIRDAQREILDALGYSLVVRTPTEDWWVDPKVIRYSRYKNFAKIMAY
jgi:hypothetical protein